jgi:serine/threonine protein kinase
MATVPSAAVPAPPPLPPLPGPPPPLPGLATTPVSAPVAAPGPRHVSEVPGYKFVKRLGEGGMGEVFKALQVSLERYVALKVLSPKLADDSDYVKRFKLEAKAAAMLNHPNIVGVIDRGEDGRIKYIAFEFIDGTSLEGYIKAKGKIPEREALKIIRDVADALRYASEKGLIHRDVKPDNILLTKEMVPKLADLGLAKMQNENAHLTQTGIVMGTPHYMAPEQALGERDLDVRADIYALGLVLYRCVTGLLPWNADSALAILTRHINEDCPDPRKFVPELSAGTAEVVRRLSARTREERPMPAEALQLIDSVLATLPGGASGPTAAPVTTASSGRMAAGAAQRTSDRTTAVVSSSAARARSTSGVANSVATTGQAPPLVLAPPAVPPRPSNAPLIVAILFCGLIAGAALAFFASHKKTKPVTPPPVPVVTDPPAPAVTPAETPADPVKPSDPVKPPADPVKPPEPAKPVDPPPPPPAPDNTPVRGAVVNAIEMASERMVTNDAVNAHKALTEAKVSASPREEAILERGDAFVSAVERGIGAVSLASPSYAATVNQALRPLKDLQKNEDTDDASKALRREAKAWLDHLTYVEHTAALLAPGATKDLSDIAAPSLGEAKGLRSLGSTWRDDLKTLVKAAREFDQKKFDEARGSCPPSGAFDQASLKLYYDAVVTIEDMAKRITHGALDAAEAAAHAKTAPFDLKGFFFASRFWIQDLTKANPNRTEPTSWQRFTATDAGFAAPDDALGKKWGELALLLGQGLTSPRLGDVAEVRLHLVLRNRALEVLLVGKLKGIAMPDHETIVIPGGGTPVKLEKGDARETGKEFRAAEKEALGFTASAQPRVVLTVIPSADSREITVSQKGLRLTVSSLDPDDVVQFKAVNLTIEGMSIQFRRAPPPKN